MLDFRQGPRGGWEFTPPPKDHLLPETTEETTHLARKIYTKNLIRRHSCTMMYHDVPWCTILVPILQEKYTNNLMRECWCTMMYPEFFDPLLSSNSRILMGIWGAIGTLSIETYSWMRVEAEDCLCLTFPKVNPLFSVGVYFINSSMIDWGLLLNGLCLNYNYILKLLIGSKEKSPGSPRPNKEWSLGWSM